MVHCLRQSARTLFILVLLCCLSTIAFAQSDAGSLRGQVLDPSGAIIPGVKVIATRADGTIKVAETDQEGRYIITGLPPGKYTVRAAAKGFAPYENTGVEITAASAQALDIRLVVTMEKQQITVNDNAKVDVSPTSNVGALVLKGADLDTLSDNPDDLAADLQALAGPAAGPNGGQIYIDGFTGGRLPPKESIREIRVNQNPFSAEFDRLGFGRIEIFTKPGTDKFHGQTFFNFGDSIFNSRNPFTTNRPPYQNKMFGGNLSGPLSKKASFFLDMERRDQDEVSAINALTLDPSFNITPLSQTVLNPRMRTTISPRLDYQFGSNHTLTARYSFSKVNETNDGVGEFSLRSQAYNVADTEQTVQLTETAVLNAKTINEIRFQYIRRRNRETGDSSRPTIVVPEAFTGGAASFGFVSNDQDRYELQNYASLTRNKHLIKFGARVRGVTLSNSTNQNYNGSFLFTSINAYRITLQGLRDGLTPDQIRAAGGGPSQFSITGGNPLASVSQLDVGLFTQDDWRLRPNFTLSLGLRYETQNNISDHSDIAPRLGFAWGIGSGKTRQPKTVIRGGGGIFYDRFGEDLTLQAIRLNGINQQQFLVSFPNFFPDVPPIGTLAGNRLPQTIRQVATNLRAPYIAQTAIGVERQLPKNIMVALTYTRSRGVHMLRSRNVNAPLPGTYNPLQPNSALRPYGNIGNIYLDESSGILNQSQLIAHINARVSSRFTLFGFYMLNSAKSDTDGIGTFPANQYDLSTEYTRAAFDVRQRLFMGSSIATRFGLRFSPFIVASSGQPFNIVVGRDLNGDSIFNDRPGLATDLTRPSVVSTPFGVFDTNPLPGQPIIPRNYGAGPGQFTVNLRLSKTFGFGERPVARAGFPEGSFPPAGPGGGPRGGDRGDRGAAPGSGGGRLGPGGMRGGPIAIFGDSLPNKRYNLTFSISARNLFNTVNLAPPIGNLSSPLFGKSNALAGGFFATPTANRRIELQLRFSF